VARAAHGVIAAALMTAGAAAAQEALAERASVLWSQLDSARKGRLIEFELAKSGLDSCRRALALVDRELREAECTEAQRRVEACERRRDDWGQAMDRFTFDAIAAGQARRYEALLTASMPACPSVVPGRGVGPAKVLAEDGRRERRAKPGFLTCESYLRALLDAVDKKDEALVQGLAQDLVARCDADHPDYRLQAEAALIRSGLDPNVVLARVRPVAPAASAASAP
jgi:hypothetical protein